MTLHVIGAGLGRTGTHSLKVGLEMIGFGPCYHMLEVIAAPERGTHWLEQANEGTNAWERIFEGFQATVDWPAAAYWRELVEAYPEAKVILSLRDSDRWYQSMMNTIYRTLTVDLPDELPANVRDFTQMTRQLIFEQTFDGRMDDRGYAIGVYEEHNQAVIDAIPAERLLAYRPGDGWEPLCRFLGVPIPDEPYPHLNDTNEFRARMGLGPID